MTDKELRKLGRRELQELFQAQAKSYEAAKKHLEELEQENKTLRESLTNLGKTMKAQHTKDEAAAAALTEKDAALTEKDAALAERDAALAEKTAALQDMERELAGARAERADKGRLEEQVDLLYESFRQVKPILQEKDRQLHEAEKRIAEQERTIRVLQERIRGRG